MASESTKNRHHLTKRSAFCPPRPFSFFSFALFLFIKHLCHPWLVLIATGWVSKWEAPPCHGPCNAGTGVWMRRATTGPPPKGVLFTCWTPARCLSATPPAQPWWTKPPSRKSPCSRCWSPWDSTSRGWDWISRVMQNLWPAMVARHSVGWQA